MLPICLLTLLGGNLLVVHVGTLLLLLGLLLGLLLVGLGSGLPLRWGERHGRCLLRGLWLQLTLLLPTCRRRCTIADLLVLID